jgi:multicomponent Na+:H+ antiporter subunit D
VVADGAVRRMLLVLGVLTAVLGALMCFTQRHVKRLLAYSTIAHIGLFLIGLAALSPLGIAAAALYAAGHAGVKGALFLLTGILLSRHQTVDEFELYGRGTQNRFSGVLFVLGGLALAGLPPFGTGLGKALLEESGFGAGMTVLVIAVSAVTAAAVVRVGLRTYFGLGPRPSRESSAEETTGRQEQPEVEESLRRTPATMLAAVLLLLGGGLLVGVLPWVARPAGAAAVRFADQRGYLAQVLHGATSRLGDVPDTGWSAEGVALGLVSAVLAAGLAALAVYARRLPGTVRIGARVVGRPVRPALISLHRLHSGHVGDYAAWLVVGAGAVAGLLALG